MWSRTPRGCVKLRPTSTRRATAIPDAAIASAVNGNAPPPRAANAYAFAAVLPSLSVVVPASRRRLR
eukprot:CAMPEP_0206128590 /NCGR_PEP_ID=MMETSP1472-20131121/32667_1 /ASSEMBLY_ACC=CAM_ASM_001108 /TAXON_ID=41880 /ORGANISM="Pycnococcus provasolii, Strain RCC251" /LENGTH=66 /DNA_ID=CAMNT_0053519797 /DNA_START=157 /DNA_END=357 /DNA_ORIENTATION=-